MGSEEKAWLETCAIGLRKVSGEAHDNGMLVRRAFKLMYQPSTLNTTPHPIGNTPALGIVWDRALHLRCWSCWCLSDYYSNILLSKHTFSSYLLACIIIIILSI